MLVYILVVSLFFCCEAFATTEKECYSGTVKIDGEPFPGATVLIKESTGLVLGFATTNQHGAYSICDIADKKEGAKIVVTGLGIKERVVPIEAGIWHYDIDVEEEVFELKELVVKQKRIEQIGDTINYYTNSFARSKHDKLSSMLRRMPGISVSTDGLIHYNGIAVSELQIEGLNMVKGGYSLATENLTAEEVASVQIIENHQEIEALKDLAPSDKVAINIKLKQSAKNIHKVTAELGGGAQWQKEDRALWDNKLTHMLFARTKQLFNIYAGNNNGVDLNRDINMRTHSYSTLYPLMGVIHPPMPPLTRQAYLDNKDHSLTFNNIFVAGRDSTIGSNISLISSNDYSNSHAIEQHTRPNTESVTYDEKSQYHGREKGVATNLFYRKNSKNLYINEEIDLILLEKRRHNSSLGSQIIDQLFYSRHLLVGNRLRSYFTIGAIDLDLESRSSFQNLPHHLVVSSDALDRRQEVELRRMISNNSLRFSNLFRIDKMNFSFKLLFDLDLGALKSLLEEEEGDSNLDLYRGGASLTSYYKVGSLSLWFELPLLYSYLSSESETKTLLYSSPMLTFSWTPFRDFKLDGGYSSGIRPSEVAQLNRMPIMTNYRTVLQHDGKITFAHWNRLHLQSSYKEVMNMLFLSISGSYMHHKLGQIQQIGFDHQGVRQLNTIETNLAAEVVSLGLQVSKGFNWQSLKLGLAFDYTRGKTPFIIDQQPIWLRSDRLLATPSIHLHLFRKVTIDYEGNWSMMKTSSQEALQNYSGTVTVEPYLSKRLSANILWHHYYDGEQKSAGLFSLLNLGVKYELERLTIRLSLDNLLNQQHYTRTYYSDLVTYQYRHTIRPRTILLNLRVPIS